MMYWIVFYHQNKNYYYKIGIPGYTTRASPSMRGGRVQSGNQTIVSPTSWPSGLEFHRKFACETFWSRIGGKVITLHDFLVNYMTITALYATTCITWLPYHCSRPRAGQRPSLANRVTLPVGTWKTLTKRTFGCGRSNLVVQLARQCGTWAEDC